MKLLRRISTRQLLALCATVIALVVGATVIAIAATGGGPKPAPKRLPVAIHHALAAPAVQGVTARIQFTNNLIANSAYEGKLPRDRADRGKREPAVPSVARIQRALGRLAKHAVISSAITSDV